MNRPRPRRVSLQRVAFLALPFALWMGACSASANTNATWGDEAIRFFDGLSTALTADDVYGILDFYAPQAVVQNRTSDFQDAAIPVADYLASHRADLSQQLLRVHLGRTNAVTLIEWPDTGRLGAVLVEMEAGAIVRETDFVDVDSLERGLLASPDVVATYEDLYRRYAEGWSRGDSAAAPGIYGDDASIRDTVRGVDVSGVAEIAQRISQQRRHISTSTVADLAGSGSGSVPGLALYLDPSSYGTDPGRAVAVYSEEIEGCTVEVVVVMEVESGRIHSEDRYPDVDSLRMCTDGSLSAGWWTGLELPSPRDESVTGEVDSALGRPISIHNGTDRLEALLQWGLDRFTSAGLDEPVVDSVTFEPTRQCDGVGGRFLDAVDSNDLVVCVDEGRLCPAGTDCETPLLAVRMSMLHELGHAWLSTNTDEAARLRLMEVSGRSVWSSRTAAWVDRGVEYAAEVLAWGLVGEPVELQQLGNPPCQQLDDAFAGLTGTAADPGMSACGQGG